jgi:hypothetical protein
MEAGEQVAAVFSHLLAYADSSLADFFTLKMQAIHSSETLVNTRSSRRHIPADDILYTLICLNLVFGTNKKYVN